METMADGKSAFAVRPRLAGGLTPFVIGNKRPDPLGSRQQSGIGLSGTMRSDQREDQEWLVFVDESGDHSAGPNNDEYPIFVMVACAFHAEDYAEEFLPAMTRLKTRHWGHEGIILHEREIRRPQGDFRMLMNRGIREPFQAELGRLVSGSGASLHAVAWDKRTMGNRDTFGDIYAECLRRLVTEVKMAAAGERPQPPMRWILESRGKREDAELLRQAQPFLGSTHTRVALVPKHRNVAGLQLADLCARPIGSRLINPDRESRAYDCIRPLIAKPTQGPVSDCGLVGLAGK